MIRVLLAFQFLTIVPLRVTGAITERDVAGSVPFFPLVGAFQGLLISVSAFLLMKVVPADIAAGITLLILIVSNGGFDLDGLADTADALSIKSSGNAEQDRSKRLAVMKDSTIGAMGVIALIMTVLLKYILIKNLLAGFPVAAVCALLFLMPAFSKWITVPPMYHGVPARSDGLGKTFLDHTGPGSVAASTGIMVCLSLLVAMTGLIGGAAADGIKLCLFLLIVFFIFGILAAKFLTKKFGGLTGDNFGALTETSEILFLVVAYIWLRHFIS